MHAFEDYIDGEGGLPPVLSVISASPGYLRAIGVPLIQGRWFEPADNRGAFSPSARRRKGVRAPLLAGRFAERAWVQAVTKEEPAWS